MLLCLQILAVQNNITFIFKLPEPAVSICFQDWGAISGWRGGGVGGGVELNIHI